MLGIYADSIRTATRTGHVRVRDIKAKPSRRSRWLPERHWWREQDRSIDPYNL